MKKTFTFITLLLFTLLQLSCNKEESNRCDFAPPVISEESAKTLEAFVNSNFTDATLHHSGFYYIISADGNNKSPDGCANVVVNYEGKLANGTVFDKATDVSFNLRNLIVGWRIGLPLLKEKGIITLILPPEMGYGTTGVKDVVPGSSITIFTIELLDVQ